MRDSLTNYFQQRYGWTPNWQRIKLVPGGWALRAGSLLCRDNNATTIATPWGWEIHYREGVRECVYAHELHHCMLMERLGLARYVIDYATELMRVGYRRCKFEQQARQCAVDYEEWRRLCQTKQS